MFEIQGFVSFRKNNCQSSSDSHPGLRCREDTNSRLRHDPSAKDHDGGGSYPCTSSMLTSHARGAIACSTATRPSSHAFGSSFSSSKPWIAASSPGPPSTGSGTPDGGDQRVRRARAPSFLLPPPLAARARPASYLLARCSCCRRCRRSRCRSRSRYSRRRNCSRRAARLSARATRSAALSCCAGAAAAGRYVLL